MNKKYKNFKQAQPVFLLTYDISEWPKPNIAVFKVYVKSVGIGLIGGI